MAQSQCRRSVGDEFWPGVVVENKESLNNPSNNPYKSGAVTLSEIFSRILTRFCRKIVGLASDRLRLRSETISASVFSFNLFYFVWVYVGGKGGFLTSVFLPVHCSVVSIIGGALIYTAIYYDSTVRTVGDDHRKRTNRRRAPPIQSERAGDFPQTLNLDLNFQSHTESCD